MRFDATTVHSARRWRGVCVRPSAFAVRNQRCGTVLLCLSQFVTNLLEAWSIAAMLFRGFASVWFGEFGLGAFVGSATFERYSQRCISRTLWEHRVLSP